MADENGGPSPLKEDIWSNAMYKDLTGKRILITGASRGIGAGIATALAACGARLVLHYHQNDRKMAQHLEPIRQNGTEAVTLRCDFRDETALTPFYQKAEQAFGGLDMLVNNAGIVPKKHLLKSPTALWRETMAINLDAPFILSNHFAKARRTADNPGMVLHISSIHGTVTSERFGLYAATKAGLNRLAQAQAIEWAEWGIRVNVIAPGVTVVSRNRQRLESTRKTWQGHLPMGRYGAVEDVAHLALFLLSSQSAWITGQIHTLDGGLTARGHYPARHDASTLDDIATDSDA
ncbi:MAG: SDR family oxidoreductase [Magnetococcales bacterium]|nr:SDR family oxidoreductase [Magnetococcales bacterium]